MSQTIQAIRGMNDILPDEAELWERFDDAVRGWLRAYGYRPIRMPIVEPTPLFARAIGEVTDIVEKEMYSFVDALNGEALTLRPEGTASCVRAVLQHSLLHGGPQRLWYAGPMFRHERPQKGRYRQFHQFGVEAFGYPGPDIDAEQIVMCARLWDELALTGIRLEINSLGNAEERSRHRAELVAYFERHRETLDADALRRLHSNPLRILDSKNPHMQALIEEAPRLMDFLGEASLAHFAGVQALLKEAGLPYRINPRLVRGLDYYNLTVFEWVTDKLGAQGTVCAGGRYDGLIEQLGGKSAPACGFALGVERLVALLKEEHGEEAGEAARAEPDVYVVHQGTGTQAPAFRAAEILRRAGLDVVFHCGGGSFKSQMKRADASGARLAVIIGEDEARSESVSLKPMREEQPQRRVPLAQLAEEIGNYLLGMEKMATFDLEEQEQISELKTWWRMHGNLVTGILLAVAIGVAGWQGWNWYQRKQAAEASAVFAAVQKAAAERDAKRAREAAGELIDTYPGTAYAAMAALTSARLQFDTGDLKTAKAQLQWVVDKARDKDLRDLGRLRLAHVLFDEKALDEALKLLSDEPAQAFATRFNELRGDLLAAQGKKSEARAAYQAALARQAADQSSANPSGRDTQYRDLLQMKLDSLGDK